MCIINFETQVFKTHLQRYLYAWLWKFSQHAKNFNATSASLFHPPKSFKIMFVKLITQLNGYILAHSLNITFKLFPRILMCVGMPHVYGKCAQNIYIYNSIFSPITNHLSYMYRRRMLSLWVWTLIFMNKIVRMQSLYVTMGRLRSGQKSSGYILNRYIKISVKCIKEACYKYTNRLVQDVLR